MLKSYNKFIGLSLLMLLFITLMAGGHWIRAAEPGDNITELETDLTAEEIMNQRDDNEFIVSARMEAEMIIVKGDRETVKEMTSYTREGEALTEFTNPRDRGTKYLKQGDELWMYFPDAEDLVRISGHMLRQGMMGSDFSYQDALESERLTELYQFEVLGEEELDGRMTYVLRGTAREDKEVSYYERKIWIDQERYIGLREELYARNGRLLKVAEVTEVELFDDDRWYPVEMVMRDQLTEDSRTIFKIEEIEFNPEIPEGTFSLESLQ
ncbi:MAG: outer membrane lipoprotein-sorting protein [Bacillota bacterium]